MKSALDVANYFVQHSAFTKTNLQVMKLTYISHGYMLAIHNKPLISDKVEAWDRGPVIPQIWHAFKKWGSRVIERTNTRYNNDVAGLFDNNNDEMDVIQGVFQHYGKYCGYYLSQITHHDGDLETPWHQCYQYGSNNTIPDEITQKYYKKLIN